MLPLRRQDPLPGGWWLTIAALAAVALIGWIDTITGEVGLTIFYLIPIIIVAWLRMPVRAAMVVILATALWLSADIRLHEGRNLPVSLWNGFARLCIFGGGLTAAYLLRRDRDILQHMALTDPLTGLFDARAFYRLLDSEVARARREHSSVAIAYVDLDNFKAVNDRYGHARGDELLCGVAEAITHSIRSADIAARLGGDEFALLLWHASSEEVMTVGHRIRTAIGTLAEEFGDVEMTATVGIVICAEPIDGRSIVRSADQLMYRGKASAKGSVLFEAC